MTENARPPANEYAEEAQRRWGSTDAWRISQRRTKRYQPQDWDAIRCEQTSIEEALAEALRSGLDSDAPAVLDLAEAHRRHIDRWYYPCSHTMHQHLGAMYASDPRFTMHYDQRAPGLAAFLASAMDANAARHG